jgi:hypothetical protein
MSVKNKRFTVCKPVYVEQFISDIVVARQTCFIFMVIYEKWKSNFDPQR